MKYRNRRTNGYDSAKEAKRAQELKLLEQCGEIRDLEFQCVIELLPSQRGQDGKVKERGVKYIADFAYTDCATGERIHEDAKGFKTKDYILKRKMCLYFHGIEVREV